jgi:hypothetical protein
MVYQAHLGTIPSPACSNATRAWEGAQGAWLARLGGAWILEHSQALLGQLDHWHSQAVTTEPIVCFGVCGTTNFGMCQAGVGRVPHALWDLPSLLGPLLPKLWCVPRHAWYTIVDLYRGLVNRLPKVGESTPKPPKPPKFPRTPRGLGVDPPNPSEGLGVGSQEI